MFEGEFNSGPTLRKRDGLGPALLSFPVRSFCQECLHSFSQAERLSQGRLFFLCIPPQPAAEGILSYIASQQAFSSKAAALAARQSKPKTRDSLPACCSERFLLRLHPIFFDFTIQRRLTQSQGLGSLELSFSAAPRKDPHF